MRLLLVEDEPVLRDMAQLILEECGYRIITAGDGKAAMKLWEQHAGEIDLLLTDMVMPEGIMGGELAERLLTQNPRLKVIYTSGYSTDLADRGASLAEGTNFLRKPYRPVRLARIVRECLDRKQGPAETAAPTAAAAVSRFRRRLAPAPLAGT